MIEEHSSRAMFVNAFTKVTPFSKYLAMILFIAMPFIGGWVGYTYAPSKTAEIGEATYQERTNEYFEQLAETKDWGLCVPSSYVTAVKKVGSNPERIGLGFEKVDDQWNRLFVPFYHYKVEGYCMKYPGNWKVTVAGVESLTTFFNRDSNSTTTPEFYFQTLQSHLPLESSDKAVYAYESSSSSLLEDTEIVVSRRIEHIGDNEALVLITTDGDMRHLRLFVKNGTTLYILKRSFTSSEYSSSIYTDFVAVAYEMISSLRPLGR